MDITGLEEVLGRRVMTKVVQMFPYKPSPLANLFPLNPLGADAGKWDEYQRGRTVAKPNARAAVSHAQALEGVKKRTSDLAHFADSKVLPSALINVLRDLGSESAQNAQSHIAREAEALTVLHRRTRDLYCATALTGTLTVTGELAFTVDFGMADEHKPDADASWATSSTDIPADIEAWKALIRQDSGLEPAQAYFNQSVAAYIRANEEVQAFIGEAWKTMIGREGVIDRLCGLQLNQVDDGYVNAAGVFTKWIPDDTFIIAPGAADGAAELQVGNVDVLDDSGKPTAIQGPGAYILVEGDPVGWKLVRKDCFLPVLLVPNAFICAAVVGD